MSALLAVLPTILVAALVAGSLVLAVLSLRRDKKAGKRSCGGCAGCALRDRCHRGSDS